MNATTQKLTLAAVASAHTGLEDARFDSQFRAGGAPTVEPEEPAVQPKIAPPPATPRKPGPDRVVPEPFQPPDPSKPCHAPDGDPSRRHTVCLGPSAPR